MRDCSLIHVGSGATQRSNLEDCVVPLGLENRLVEVEMKRNKERSVRNRLRDIAGDRVRWVESAQGGTDGMPDAIVDCFVRPVELELKLWHWENGKLLTKIRPVQRRYHLLAHLAKRKSGFLVGFETPVYGTESGRWDWLLAGHRPKDGMVLGVFASRHMPLGNRTVDWQPRLRRVESFLDLEIWAQEEWGCGR